MIMNLAISNIAWERADDDFVYNKMAELGFKYIEIAPTALVPQNPYSSDGIKKIYNVLDSLYKLHGIKICSMQSILYGVSSRLFGTEEERQDLFKNILMAVDCAYELSCRNLVFGCPKNRVIENEALQYNIGVDFFKRIADYCEKKNVYFSLEANPVIYNTNYINTTQEALKLVKLVDCSHFGINYDLGCVLYNNEDIDCLDDVLKYVNHIHISEPYLAPVDFAHKTTHIRLRDILKKQGYGVGEGFRDNLKYIQGSKIEVEEKTLPENKSKKMQGCASGCISIEMKKTDNLNILTDIMRYIADIFAV